MKKIFLIFIIAFFCCVFIAHRNNDPRLVISNLIKKGCYIKSGELKYRIYLLGILPVAEAFLGIDRSQEYMGRKVYHSNVSAQNLQIVSKIFSGYAILDSYIDRRDFNPIFFKQKIIIADKKDSDREIIYDQENGVMSIGQVKRQIFADTQDPLSAIFNLRHRDLSKVKEFQMNINSNQKNYILKGSSTGQDIWVDKTRYKVFLTKADIYRRQQNPYHKSKITMVLVQEKENIPIVIKIFAGGVLISAKLVDIK